VYDEECDDGIFCDGIERCIASACHRGDPVLCDDGVDCTVDRCDEATDACAATSVDLACDDGLACDGLERCDAALGCVPADAAACDDGIACTVDACEEPAAECASLPDHSLCGPGERCDPAFGCLPGAACAADADCDDGFHCNGLERCVDGGCAAGVLPSCDDGVSCTTDRCDEPSDRCVHLPNDAACDDGGFCDGVETCDALRDCQDGAAPSCADAVGCTEDTCDEAMDECIHAADDLACAADEACDSTEGCLCNVDAARCGLCGDVNQDRRVDIADGSRCRDLLRAGGFPVTCCDTFRADFQRDGDVDLDDCRAIEAWQLEGGPACPG
jgi:hypothetical protein